MTKVFILPGPSLGIFLSTLELIYEFLANFTTILKYN